MHRNDLLTLVKRGTFKPFRITVSTGETFDVSHPEMLLVAETFVALPRPGAPLPEISNLAWVDLVHVVHCQPLESAAA